MLSTFKRLTAGEDAGDEASTAVVEYEQPKSISSLRRRKSSDYQNSSQSREYRGSNLSSRSRRAIESKGNTKSADNIIDARYEDVGDTYYSKVIQDSTRSRKLQNILHDEPPVQEEVSATKSSCKRPSASKTASKSPNKRPSEGFSTQKSPKKRVLDAKDPEPNYSIDDQTRIWSRYGRVEDETYKKVKDAREDAEYSIGLRKAKTRGQQRGIDLENVEELAYQAETNRRETEQLKEDVRKAQERGINRATPFPEKIAKAEKAAGKAIGAGFKEINKATATFAQSRMGKNITKANEATLRGMKEAGDRVRGSIGAGRKNLTPSALNKPRAFGSSSTTNPALKITTRIVRRGRNDVVCYFDQYGRQISAAAARAYLAGKVPVQKPAANVNTPLANVNTPLANLNQRTDVPFALGRPKTLLADLRNHGIPFALGSHQASFVGGTHQAPFAVGGTYEAPFAPGHYQPPFAVGSKPTLVVGGYTGNPVGDMRRPGNPLGDMFRVSDPIGMIRREGSPLGDDERRGHTSRILRGQVKKAGSPLGDSEKAGHTSRMVRDQTKKPAMKSASKKRI